MAARIFVYGSLMKGFFNYEKYLKHRAVKVEKGKTKGVLYHLENKGYPGMVDGDDEVYGEIITYTDEDLGLVEMDKLEGFEGVYDPESPYNRVSYEVVNLETNEIVILDAYKYNDCASCNINDDKILIDSGSWSEYMSNRTS